MESEPTRIGIERFNYELQRREILLADGGWHPVVPLALHGQEPIGLPRSVSVPAEEMAATWERLERSPSPWLPIKTDPPPGRSLEIQTREAELTRENIMLRSERDAWHKFYDEKNVENIKLREMIQPITDREGQLLAEIGRLRKQLWLPTEPGNHPYHGPTAPDPKTGRLAPIPDPVHESFHQSIGNVLAGKVMPEARRQMQEALKNAPKEKPPLRLQGDQDDHRRIGWRMNDAV